MNNRFLLASKKIADRFLQNVIFIDDMADKSENDSPQAFNPMVVTKFFASILILSPYILNLIVL